MKQPSKLFVLYRVKGIYYFDVACRMAREEKKF